MATKTLSQFFGNKHKGLTVLTVKATIGGSGAPTLVTAGGYSRGISTLTVASPGVYTLTLKDKWSKFLGLQMSLLHATASTVGGQEVVSEAVASTGVIVFKTKDVATGGGAAADPASGSIMYLFIYLDSSKG